MAEPPRLALNWVTILIGVVCVVAANLLLATIDMAVVLPGPHWIWSSLTVAAAVLIWFAIVARVSR